MNDRTRRPRHRYLIPGTLLAVLLAWPPPVAGAQRVAGSLDVALTVLPPVAPASVTVTELRLDPDGTVFLRAAVPTTTGASRLVATRISSSADGFLSRRELPYLVRRSSATGSAAREASYRIEVGRTTDGAGPHDVRLRVECLVVAGT